MRCVCDMTGGEMQNFECHCLYGACVLLETNNQFSCHMFIFFLPYHLFIIFASFSKKNSCIVCLCILWAEQ